MDDGARLERVEERLVAHAAAGVPEGLTEPDPGGAERWKAGQVWAHMAEFPAYWQGQVTSMLRRRAAGEPEPLPFGRTKTDPSRIDAIERDRHTDPGALLARVLADVAAFRAEVAAWPADAWMAIGLHPTLGELSMAEIVERFVVGHLEEHVAQLDLLRDG